MVIKSNAASTEITSPFYKANKEFCKQFEAYLTQREGKVKGVYNAFSYAIYGKIENPKPWSLFYKKATYTDTGNLLLSTEKETLLTLARWSTRSVGLSHLDFEIKRKTFLQRIKQLFSNNVNSFVKGYVIKGTSSDKIINEEFILVLKDLFESKEVYSITHEQNELSIELRSKKHYFSYLDKLIVLFD